MATLNNTKVPQEVSRVIKLDGATALDIKDELDNVLRKGWSLVSIFSKGQLHFAVFTRPRRQA